MLAIIGGIALMLTLLLVYPAIWKNRKESPKDISEGEKVEKIQPVVQWFFSNIPFVLIVLFIVVTIYGIIYTIRMAIQPPNW